VPLYLSKCSWTRDLWVRSGALPKDRRAAAPSYVEQVGGGLQGFWYAFGTHVGCPVWEGPENVSAAGLALTISADDGSRSLETTGELIIQESMDALRPVQQVFLPDPDR
jgi:uncharacterized protein with GYD domain